MGFNSGFKGLISRKIFCHLVYYHLCYRPVPRNLTFQIHTTRNQRQLLQFPQIEFHENPVCSLKTIVFRDRQQTWQRKCAIFASFLYESSLTILLWKWFSRDTKYRHNSVMKDKDIKRLPFWYFTPTSKTNIYDFSNVTWSRFLVIH